MNRIDVLRRAFGRCFTLGLIAGSLTCLLGMALGLVSAWCYRCWSPKPVEEIVIRLQYPPAMKQRTNIPRATTASGAELAPTQRIKERT